MDPNEISRRLIHPGVATYFSGNGHRIAAFRALLDLLSIPHPDWAARGISGAGFARRATMTAYQEDNPAPRPMVLPDRKTAATPEQVQAAKATNERRLTRLYDQTFPQ